MKNPLYLTLTALFVLEIFKFLLWLFVHVGKRLDKKAKVNFKIYDIRKWEKSNCSTHIARYLKTQRQSDNEIDWLI